MGAPMKPAAPRPIRQTMTPVISHDVGTQAITYQTMDRFGNLVTHCDIQPTDDRCIHHCGKFWPSEARYCGRCGESLVDHGFAFENWSGSELRVSADDASAVREFSVKAGEDWWSHVPRKGDAHPSVSALVARKPEIVATKRDRLTVRVEYVTRAVAEKMDAMEYGMISREALENARRRVNERAVPRPFPPPSESAPVPIDLVNPFNWDEFQGIYYAILTILLVLGLWWALR